MDRPRAATVYPGTDKKRQSFVQPKVASLWVARRGRNAMLGTIAPQKVSHFGGRSRCCVSQTMVPPSGRPCYPTIFSLSTKKATPAP